MRDIPILFTGAMVRGILADEKWHTRRVISLRNAGYCDPENATYQDEDGRARSMLDLCPYGKKGDRLWVRETWRPSFWDEDFSNVGIEYRADGKISDAIPSEHLWKDNDRCVSAWESASLEMIEAAYPIDGNGDFVWGTAKNPLKWRPSIFMPRAACRLTLDVLSVRIERLQSITEADAIAEGVKSIAEYKTLWDSINKKGGKGWDTNPWLWVVEFKRSEAT